MRYSYVWEKFHLAVCGLASSRQSLQTRLGDTCLFHLMHAEHDGLPPEIQEDFARLRDRLLSAKEFGDEGQVAASARNIDEVEAGELLDVIISMYDRVAKYGPNTD